MDLPNNSIVRGPNPKELETLVKSLIVTAEKEFSTKVSGISQLVVTMRTAKCPDILERIVWLRSFCKSIDLTDEKITDLTNENLHKCIPKQFPSCLYPAELVRLSSYGNEKIKTAIEIIFLVYPLSYTVIESLGPAIRKNQLRVIELSVEIQQRTMAVEAFTDKLLNVEPCPVQKTQGKVKEEVVRQFLANKKNEEKNG